MPRFAHRSLILVALASALAGCGRVDDLTSPAHRFEGAVTMTRGDGTAVVLLHQELEHRHGKGGSWEIPRRDLVDATSGQRLGRDVNVRGEPRRTCLFAGPGRMWCSEGDPPVPVLRSTDTLEVIEDAAALAAALPWLADGVADFDCHCETGEAVITTRAGYTWIVDPLTLEARRSELAQAVALNYPWDGHCEDGATLSRWTREPNGRGVVMSLTEHPQSSRHEQLIAGRDQDSRVLLAGPLSDAGILSAGPHDGGVVSVPGHEATVVVYRTSDEPDAALVFEAITTDGSSLWRHEDLGRFVPYSRQIDDLLLVGVRTDKGGAKQPHFLLALDLASGAVRWRYEM